MNEFIKNTDIFVRNLNRGTIEHGQIIDTLEILLDKAMDYQTENNAVDSSFTQILSLLEVVMRSMRERQSIDEDIVLAYEMRTFKEFKELVKEVA
ncbi:hypothetical protein [Candidatus Enterococcus courvalinii]|uniref:Uncharacterized protein n=1 Tax=Candidatus Enterococcus courvalinii TaxID=2815329 RepID=A0ABS3HZC2_9ENTE|nr:hypothetical protein [Enterococcus sp. MSG2901]MBO0481807.1 hypothetical protein [Enterococcus sp. MSG2901]